MARKRRGVSDPMAQWVTGTLADLVGVSLFANPRIAAGTAWAVEQGAVGTVGFEQPLSIDTWEDKATRSWWVQAWVVPALAVDRPYAAKKITGLAG